MSQTYEQQATGIRLRYGDGLKLVEDHYLDRTYGVTLLGAPQKGANDSRPLVLRVGVVQDGGPVDAGAAAQRMLREYEPAAIRSASVDVARQRAVALLGVPG